MRLSGGRAALACLLTLFVSLAPGLDAQWSDSLRDVLDRAGTYVVEYGAALATVLADEEYVQALVTGDGRAIERRVLEAEIAFVPLGGGREWQAVRNVLRVDGEPVAGAERRLERLFRDAPASVMGQAQRLAAESARYNLGPLLRTFNAPTMPLQFLHPAHQDRFRFSQLRTDSAPEQHPDDAWVVRFEDRGGATLIRNTAGRAVPVEGQFRILPRDGRIVEASFSASGFLPGERGEPRSHAELVVRWREDERLGLWVPDEMRERYTGPWDDRAEPYAIVGTARYVNYRRFDVEARILDVIGSPGATQLPTPNSQLPR